MRKQIMGRMLTLRIVGKVKESYIKIRENLTINNLKAILNREMKIEKGNIKIMLDGHE